MAKKDGKYAGFWIRMAAVVLDGIIVGTFTGLLQKIPFLPFSANFFRDYSFLINITYTIFLWVNWNGQTIGKKVFGIKVVREDGNALDYKTAVIRYLSYIPSWIVFGLGFLWVAWDERKQGWHDKIAKTLVVKD